MADPFLMRLRRLVHSFLNASALPVALFLVQDTFRPNSPTLPDNDYRIEGDYDADARALDDLKRDGIATAAIFQTWKSRTDIPANFRYWRNSFMQSNPEWRAILWDDDDNRAFIADRFPWFLSYYDAYPREIFRVDIVRFFFLFEFGGFYADMDAGCLKPIEGSANGGDVVLCRMGANKDFEHSIPNAIMASKPFQAFWLFAISRAMRAADACNSAAEIDAMGPESLTGPILLKRCADEFAGLSPEEVAGTIAPVIDKLTDTQRERIQYGRVTLLEPETWYPLDWTNPFHKTLCNRLRKQARTLSMETASELFPESTTITYWNHSW